MYPSLYDYINNTNLSKAHPEGYCPPSSSTFQLPSPHYITLEDGMIFKELLHQQHLFSDDHTNYNANNIGVQHDLASQDIRVSMGKCSNKIGEDGLINKPKNSNKRRRSRASNNERHSKINTAQGPRDRRMRLSLDVGKKFFKLQDMLGFDKASKTVEWLLMKSKSNIQELISSPYNGKYSSFSGVTISESSTSKCELLSEYMDGDQNTIKGKKKTRRRGVRKSCYLLRPLAKETREMARKRARERTLEKSSKLACVSGDHQFSKFRLCNILDKTILEQEMNCLGSHFNHKQGVIDYNSSLMIGGWNPSFLLNYQQTGVHPQEHQLNDHGNLWEVKN